MENFFKTRAVLVKTRKAQTHIKLSKINYIHLLTSLLTTKNNVYRSVGMYSVYNTSELVKNIWKFYKSLVPSNFGLISSNYHKSTLLRLVTNSARPVVTPRSSVLMSFEVYHFHTQKDAFKKFIIFFMNMLSFSYLNYSINFNVYNSYVWLSWYLRLNPMNNIFYLKVYNY